MKAIIREKEADGAKLLTWNLFDLTKDGLKPRKNEVSHHWLSYDSSTGQLNGSD
jgi:hypothetical protein